MNKILFVLSLFIFTLAISPKTSQQILDLTNTTNRIIDYVMGTGSGHSWNECAKFCDKFGARTTLSPSVEASVDYAIDLMKREGFEKVHTQSINQTAWVRGEESVEMIKPRRAQLQMLGLGGSVATAGITAQVIIIKDFKELEARSSEVRGKIVLFNYPFTSYGDAVQYRVYGASNAAKHGAVAALVRSITPNSLGTPHTGTLRYAEGVAKIPSAALTIEDVDMLQRMSNRGETIEIKLVMKCTFMSGVGRNAVGEITGSRFPNEIIVVGGHIDSWDVGQGAMDDADGIFVSFEAIRILKKLGLRPKRTIRLIWWSDEEYGGTGADQYVRDQEAHLRDHVLAFESDAGTFTPTGFAFTGTRDVRARGIIEQIVRAHLWRLGVTQLTNGGYAADTAPLISRGVPGMVINTRNERYFWYHHSHADVMNVLTPKDLDLCSGAISTMMYVIADLDERLPRGQ